MASTLPALLNDRDFFRTLVRLGLPVALQSFFTAFLALVDNIMVGQLGAGAVAAVGLAGQYFFVLLLILIPIGGGIGVFAAQFWGRGDLERVQKVAALGLGLALVFAAAFFAVAALAPGRVMGVFSLDPAVVEDGAAYLRFACWGYLPVAVNFCLAAALRSLREVRLPLYAGVVGVALNTALNYLLIYGACGFPRMGVPGSGLATAISQTVALLVLAVAVARKRPELFRSLGQAARPSLELARRFFAQTGVMLAKDLVWALGITAYMVVYARIGTAAAASMNITNTVRELAIVLFIGIASASQVVIGNMIGAGRGAEAQAEARKFLAVAAAAGLAVGLALAAARGWILLPYRAAGPAADGAMDVMLVYGLSLGLAAYNQVFVMGVMRPGGDNAFCALMDAVAVWLIGLPLAILAGLVWRLPVAWVFALVTAQELFKAALLTGRFRGRRWMRSLVDGV